MLFAGLTVTTSTFPARLMMKSPRVDYRVCRLRHRPLAFLLELGLDLVALANLLHLRAFEHARRLVRLGRLDRQVAEELVVVHDVELHPLLDHVLRTDRHARPRL